MERPNEVSSEGHPSSTPSKLDKHEGLRAMLLATFPALVGVVLRGEPHTRSGPPAGNG
jgi:hypothetical protein